MGKSFLLTILAITLVSVLQVESYAPEYTPVEDIGAALFWTAKLAHGELKSYKSVDLKPVCRILEVIHASKASAAALGGLQLDTTLQVSYNDLCQELKSASTAQIDCSQAEREVLRVCLLKKVFEASNKIKISLDMEDPFNLSLEIKSQWKQDHNEVQTFI